jgi:hypothetical protein
MIETETLLDRLRRPAHGTCYFCPHCAAPPTRPALACIRRAQQFLQERSGVVIIVMAA